MQDAQPRKTFEDVLNSYFTHDEFYVEVSTDETYSTITSALISAGYTWHEGYIGEDVGRIRNPDYPLLRVLVSDKGMIRSLMAAILTDKIPCVQTEDMLRFIDAANKFEAKLRQDVTAKIKAEGVLLRPKI